MKLVAIILLSVLIPSCSKSRAEFPGIKLIECESYVINGEETRLCFDQLVSDSRCPHNMDCIWAGVGVAKFTFHKNNEFHTLTLATMNVTNQYSKDTTVAGYKIELLDLHPYPGTIANPQAEDRTAEVMLTRL